MAARLPPTCALCRGLLVFACAVPMAARILILSLQRPGDRPIHVETVFFDLDGTLTDPFEGIGNSIRYALEKLGVPVPDEASLRGYVGPPLKETFCELVGEASAAHALTLYRERFGLTGWIENRPYDGIHEALEETKLTGRRLFVTTSKPTVYAERIVEHFELDSFFDGVFGAELDGTRSNKSELVAWAIDRVAPRGQAVIVGDRRHDIIAGLDNMLGVIGVSYGFGTVGELRTAGAEKIAERPSDIPALIDQE